MDQMNTQRVTRLGKRTRAAEESDDEEFKDSELRNDAKRPRQVLEPRISTDRFGMGRGLELAAMPQDNSTDNNPEAILNNLKHVTDDMPIDKKELDTACDEDKRADHTAK